MIKSYLSERPSVMIVGAVCIIIGGATVFYILPIVQTVSSWQRADKLTLISAFLTMFGWFIVAYLSIYLQRKLLRDNERMKVFEEIWTSRKTMNDLHGALIASIQSKPFILIEACKIGGLVTKDPSQMAGGEIKAWENWQKYLARLFENKVAYTNSVMELWTLIEMRSYAFPTLERAIKTLFAEYTSIADELDNYYSFLQTLPYNWESWDKKNIEDRSTVVWTRLYSFGTYAGVDMMNLVHNNLVSSYFPYKKAIRVPGDPICKVLTENGLCVLTERDKSSQ